ncbi:MAG: hypothetical protein P8J50_03440 [Acidimicrobiales bacterium]|jgi:ABC-type glycerol-3-phosphate transport system substrate-binding protein|nr:hypothetical protein [Acidimicrobiales bacterium]
MRRLPHFLAALVALALVAAACAEDASPVDDTTATDPTTTSAGDDPAPTNTEPAPDGDAAWRNGDSSFLFD